MKNPQKNKESSPFQGRSLGKNFRLVAVTALLLIFSILVTAILLRQEEEGRETEQKKAAETTNTPAPTPTNVSTPMPTNTLVPTPTNTPIPTPIPTSGGQINFTGNIVSLADAKIGDSVLFGSYEQDNDLENGAEAIEWLVLDWRDGKLLLLSMYALDCKKYNEEYTEVTWETCTLRSWLNQEFYQTAFTGAEQERIAETPVVNEDNLDYGIEGGNDTLDKVFLLSVREVTAYLAPDPDEWALTRRAKATDYAKAQGGWVYTEAEYGAYGTGEYDGNGWWWLRSPGMDSYSAMDADQYGYINRLGDNVDYDGTVVRPAVWVEY